MFRLPNINHPTDSGKIQQIADFLFQFIRQLNMEQESTKDTKPPSDNENTTIVVNKSAEDYIVEQGETIGKDTEGNDAITWTYRKWASGKAECWGYHTYNGVKLTAGWGGALYVGRINQNRINYPLTFIERPQENVTLRGTKYSAFLYANSDGNGMNTTTETAIYGAGRGDDKVSEATTMTLDFYVIGRWK